MSREIIARLEAANIGTAPGNLRNRLFAGGIDISRRADQDGYGRRVEDRSEMPPADGRQL
jgi:hypothetical protein